MKQALVEARALKKRYQGRLSRRAFTLWSEARPALRQEQENLKVKEDLLIKKFRLVSA